MGIIAAITPGKEQRHIIPRIHTTCEDIIAVGKIDIKFYKQSTNKMESMFFQKLSSIDDVEDQLEELNCLIKGARPLKPELPISTNRKLSWKIKHINPKCQSRKMNTTPVVTFDQPLEGIEYCHQRT
ncbi:hypothetical protein DPMN_017964 [Dreissena polymorpha]|uniref:Uncharacterized protein n=1 Tax=Dreissena polymorpha TaxID=45954 RepID=A0A9D4NCE1_DREPO|nr:hypothetical protein DPMN_017964 [Dreissena polymorpha]